MAKQSTAGLMSQAEYARHRKVNRSYITRLKQAGVLVMHGGKIDVRATDTVLDDKPVDDVEPPAAQPPVPPAAPSSRPAADSIPQAGGASFGQARTIEMVFRAKLRRLEFETKQGRLIEADAVRKTIADAVRTMRDGILGLPDRLATVLAAESDPKKVHVSLKTELSRELEGLAHAISRI
jgi:hypothetical protein